MGTTETRRHRGNAVIPRQKGDEFLKPAAGLAEDGAGACPSSARQKVGRDGCGMFNPFGSGELMSLGHVVVGPINEQRCADEILTGSRPPETAVVAVVAIVAHHEE